MSATILVFISLLIISVYIIIGLLFSNFVGSFMDVEPEKYILAMLLVWPLVLVIGAIFQLIHFIKAMFKGDY